MKVNIVLRSAYFVSCVTSDDAQEAYNLIKDLEPSTPQVLENLWHYYIKETFIILNRNVS